MLLWTIVTVCPLKPYTDILCLTVFWCTVIVVFLLQALLQCCAWTVGKKTQTVRWVWHQMIWNVCNCNNMTECGIQTFWVILLFSGWRRAVCQSQIYQAIQSSCSCISECDLFNCSQSHLLIIQCIVFNTLYIQVIYTFSLKSCLTFRKSNCENTPSQQSGCFWASAS